MRLDTGYEIGEIPHAEHPCPQARRKNWLCLNGKWGFQKLDKDGQTSLNTEILVPFSPESLLSGIEEGFCLKSGETLVYTRSFLCDESLLLGRTLLRFGAVDSECEVFCNDTLVGTHKGGFTAFLCDVSDVITLGENTLKVVCKDEGTRNHGARGKQLDNHGGIWYTPQSGIWQTVWLESMPRGYIGDFKIMTDAQKGVVKIDDVGLDVTEIVVYDDGLEILRKKFRRSVLLEYPFEFWSPEHPKLYDFVLTNESGDEVWSYFGVRTFSQTVDADGKARLTLNGKPYFFNGVLDQGYWSDGMLTYPSDKSAFDELKMLKDMGFNTVRKHIKIEPMRWYYHCDKLGLIVWQDFVNGGGEYKWSHIALFPFLGAKHDDSDYKYFAREDADGRSEFMTATSETLHQLFNCTSIALWTIFNEGWGQFDSARFVEIVKNIDPTRLIDSVSGWHDQGKEKTTLKSLHIYYTRLKVPKDTRPVVLSEFGGYSMKTEGHVFDESKEFGYKKFKTQAKLITALKKLYLKKVLPLIKKGLCGCIYTQVSDVEEEINGLVTYDRKVVKIPVDVMAEINAQITAEACRCEKI